MIVASQGQLESLMRYEGTLANDTLDVGTPDSNNRIDCQKLVWERFLRYLAKNNMSSCHGTCSHFAGSDFEGVVRSDDLVWEESDLEVV